MPSTFEAALAAVENVTVHRGTAVILDGVSWSMDQGEHWVLLGANGSGKTSLLMTLAGYLTPTAGRIAVLGRVFGESDWRELRREIGIVSSNLRQRIEEAESAREVVASGKYAMINFWGKMSRSDQREGEKWLERVGCGALARRPWSVLSQGERQRVLIARALISRPRLLILDEPCAGLDPVARERFLGFVESLTRAAKGPSIVLVTHHIEEITPGFTHAILLKAGRVVAQGKRRSVLSSAHLSTMFDYPVIVRRHHDRLMLNVQDPMDGSVA